MTIAMDGEKFDWPYPYCELEFCCGGEFDCAETGPDESSMMMEIAKRVKRDELLLNFGAMR